jgi:hypothetical protein
LIVAINDEGRSDETACVNVAADVGGCVGVPLLYVPIATFAPADVVTTSAPEVEVMPDP